MRIVSLHKKLEYNKGLFMYRVLTSEAPDYISSLYTHIPSRYSNSRNYKLSLPRTDIFKASIWCFSMEQPTSDSQILSATQRRMDCHRILLRRERQTVRFSSDCHYNDWSFETYCIHPYNSDQSLRLLVRVTPSVPPLPPPYCSL